MPVTINNRSCVEVARNTLLNFPQKIILDIQWFLVSAENQLRPMYYSTWYIVNFSKILRFSETHQIVSRGSEE